MNQTTPMRRIRAVVFSNFPGQFFEKQFQPKLLDHNIEVVKTINVDKTKSADLASAGADVFIAMIDIMSNDQRQRVKELAKKHGVRFVGLPRKGDWHKFLDHIPLLQNSPNNVLPIRSSAKGYSLKELAAMEQEPPPSAPSSSLEDVMELLPLFEEENAALLEAKKKLEGTIKEREDALLNALEENEQLKRATAVVEQQLKNQTAIRADLESELTATKQAVDALANQVESKHGHVPPGLLPEEVASRGTVAALRSHNTRLKNENEALNGTNITLSKKLETEQLAHNTVRQQYQDEIKVRQALEARLKTLAVPTSSKEDLIAWGNAIKDVVTGNPTGYRVLLGLAAKHGIDVQSIIAQIE